MQNGGFAKFCNKVNFNKPLIHTIMIEQKEYKAIYEGLRVLCYLCGCIGHAPSKCLSNSLNQEKPVVENAINNSTTLYANERCENSEGQSTQITYGDTVESYMGPQDNNKPRENTNKTSQSYG